MGLETVQIRVYGIVQGVGFRPTVSRHALAAGICGVVSNKGPYVEIIAQGTSLQLSQFRFALEHQPPKRAAILKVDVKPLEDCPLFSDFSIMESSPTQGEIFISPDIAICEECTQELFDPHNRRYLHPFINCTCCGPRMTILDALPYDRERTSMKKFPMCSVCSEEYFSPESRRYDAQPVCCNQCGPEVYLLGRSEKSRDAITAARRTIAAGGIAAVKGIGGFHLCCDAENETAVRLLRERKHRPAKPFAVMARDLDTALQICSISTAQKEMLTGHQKPIILLDKNKASSLAPSVAPGNPRIGLMLPYAPIQLLLFDYDDDIAMPKILVMTSGNISGAPICRDDKEAQTELGHLADCILSHNRSIRIRADDTVMDYFDDQPYMIRRSRGFAPLPMLLSGEKHGTVLALGGELKNSFCLARDNLYYLSPYVGDLEDLRTVKALRETIQRFDTLLEAVPQAVVCDMHPGYNSTAMAQEMDLPVISVQHHYAHILSCMAENDFQGNVIGIALDGTGYGLDGTIWGGEVLLANVEGFHRVGHIVPFLQIGGDASARDGWRIAVGMIGALTRDRERALEQITALGLTDRQQASFLLTMAEKQLNTVVSTSAGRLFDGVSAILGICRSSTYEGEASMALQFCGEAWESAHSDTQPLLPESPDIMENGIVQMATDRLVLDLIERKLQGEDTDYLAYLFHRRLAELLSGAAAYLGHRENVQTVALSGGVFQNKLLLKLTVQLLKQQSFHVLTHSMVPPNDGGIALGQAMFAMNQLQNTHVPKEH